MNDLDTSTAADACYLALKARDPRFDGCFFTGVTSTGIYCRPVCRVRTPKQENCRFFTWAAQAEVAGFRPCLRCRPELAPRRHLPEPPQDSPWSTQDASRILANQAARLMDTPTALHTPSLTIARLAHRLGISDRHLRRIFESQFGVSPLQYLQTCRLLCAKHLLTDTGLAVSQVAHLSGFASVRRFNASFVGHYRLSPSQLRKMGAPDGAAATPSNQGIPVRLAYRPPYDIAALLGFLHTRQIPGMSLLDVSPACAHIGQTLAIQAGGQRLTGWVLASFDETRCRVNLRVSESLGTVLPQVISGVRGWLDLDADPQAINQVLHQDFPHGNGLRVPGTLDGFELAVRAVLGQQITVAAARTLTHRLLARFGEPVTTPFAGMNRLFPSPQSLACASGDELGILGIVKQRQAAIQALAQAVASGQLCLDAGVDVPTTLAQLRALPGIGDWTAQYIAMRALRWPDAFPAADVALHKALVLNLASKPHAAKAAQLASKAWQPWRSYAVVRAWTSLTLPTAASSTSKILSNI
jgi:AraC family transcriptional regulator of adaptative response / DNA-3-methyladenine glycosylase II